MGRGQTTAEFAAEGGPLWYYAGGVFGDPGIVSDEAREVGDRDGLDAELLDEHAEALGWEIHNSGWRAAIEAAAVCVAGAVGECRCGAVTW